MHRQFRAIILVSLVCLSRAAFCQDEAITPDQAGEREFKSTTQARFLITNRDRGIEADSTNNVEPSTLMELETFRISFKKEMSPRYRSKLTINFLAEDLPSAVEDAQLIYQPNLVFSIIAGKGQILQGGYESLGDKIGIDLESLYSARYFPFVKKHGPILELHTQTNGDLTVQLTEDVTNQDTDRFGKKFPYFSNVRKQPAVVIQWLAKFGKIVPLMQIGSYDLHHSSFVTGGVEFNLAGCKVSADLTVDNRGEKIQRTGAEQAEALNHHILNKVFQAEYTSIWKLIPFVKWTGFSIRQPNDESMNRTDLKANTDRTSWDDNQSAWQFGLHSVAWGTEFVPFLAYSEISGLFYRSAEFTEISERTERFSTIGVTGRF